MNETSATRKAALWVGIVFLLGVALGGIAGYAFAHRGYAAGTAPTNETARRQQRVEQLTRIEPHHGAEATTRRHPDRHGGAVQNHPQADRAADGCGSREGAQSDSGDSNARAETEIRGFSEAVGRREKEKRAVAGAETQSVQTLTISFPMLPPVKSMLMASGDFSRPSMMVSRSLSFPNIFH